ncbi:hypothetical protein F444_01966 [Phytophthora nicotianae P1976]|uniref:SLC26A/SulP transporter domain-containing protein n=1 Tax=Phytophthora nicotianae P1976 TaxID=1317066 RepID=A0A081AYX8_PHYNI|nr:hypothetical protein F444_01966 [Phytophthora nicotianae P1976]
MDPIIRWIQSTPDQRAVHCTKKTPIELVQHHAPILRRLPHYKISQDLKFDIVAGITVAMTLVPQEVSLSTIMHVPAHHGLYTAATSPLIYALFESSTVLSVASGSEVALLTGSILEPIEDEKERIATGIMIAFLSGTILLLVRIFNLSPVADFFSRPFQNVLGVKFESHDNPVQTLYQNLKNIGHSNKNALAVGLISIAYLITIKLIKKRFFPSPVLSKTQEKKPRRLSNHLPSTCAQTDENRPKALNRKSIDDSVKSKVVLIAIFLCSYIPLEPWYGFDDGLIGGGRFGTILLNSFTVVLVVSLSSIAMSKRLAIQRGEDIDTAQELTGIGIASVVCGFFQAMPPTGRMSRTAVNMQHGHTQLASIITTLIVILSLYTLIGTLYYLPRATLASIIIVAGYTLVEFNEAKRLYRVGVLEGLIASIICSVLALMIKTKRTPVVVLGELDNGTLVDRDLFPNAQDLNDIIVIRVESSLYFANCERVALAIEKTNGYEGYHHARRRIRRVSHARLGCNYDSSVVRYTGEACGAQVRLLHQLTASGSTSPLSLASTNIPL